jgi:CubicO group peptidase (beta-lactamase class C family)
MQSLETVRGIRTRGPTVQELLTHRGGIYSQTQRLNHLQTRAIRDFTLTLDESTAIIARQPLAFVPGTDYAYSGAGYCLLGAMAEKAMGNGFEQLLEENLCRPLGMTSTTYFPDPNAFAEIAVGGLNGGTAPHLLGPRLKFPLVGGSLYSNARDIERFARMVALGGSVGSTQVISPTAHSHFVSQPVANQPYGHGWTLTRQRGNVVAVSHMGSLPPYQSAVRVNLYDKTYRIVLWTLARPKDRKTMTGIKNRIAALLR